jgi:membrane protein
VISLISKIEEAFNHTWRIHSARGFLQRFSYYLSVLLIGPVLIFSAMGVTATMMNTQLVKYVISVEPFGTAFYIAGVLTPYLFTILAFTFVYIFLPNTNVKAVPALIGATAAGLLWKGAGWIFASFVAGSTKYNAIYSSFAVLIMFMIWLYVSWLIFLLGSQITFYYQKPQFIRPAKPSRELSNRIKEKLAFVLMYWIARRFFKGQKPWTLEQLVQKLDVPEIILNNTLNAMQRKGLIVETASDPTTYIPAKDLDRITLYELITVIRKAEEEQIILDEHRLTVPKVDHVITDINRALEQTLNHKTVREWIMEEPTNIAELDKAKDTALPTNQDQDDKERLY